MSFAIFIMLAIVIVLLVGSLPAEEAMPSGVYHSPVLIALFAILCFMLLTVLFYKSKRNYFWRSGFYMLHLGVLSLLVGSGITYFFSKKYNFVSYLFDERMLSKISERANIDRQKGDIEFPFLFRVKDFEVKWHVPKRFILYSYDKVAGEFDIAKDQQGRDIVYKIKDFASKKELDLGDKGKIKVAKLKDSAGNWLIQYDVNEENVLYSGEKKASYYGCDIVFAPLNNEQNLTVKRAAINSPVFYEDWRFFLMGYDRSQENLSNGRVNYVVLMASYDPGRIPVHTGIWVTIVGAFFWAFSPVYLRIKKKKAKIKKEKLAKIEKTSENGGGK